MSTGRRLAAAAVASGLMALASLAFIGLGSASAYTDINSFTAEPSTTQAGGHPDVDVRMAFDAHNVDDGNQVPFPSDPCNCDDARRIAIHYPTGFIGNPHVIPRCSLADLAIGQCSSDAQLGTAVVIQVPGPYTPIYNMETTPDEAGRVAFLIPLLGAPALITLSGRTDSDYGLDAISGAIPHPIPTEALALHLWGIPADPVHDPARFFTPLKFLGQCPAEYPEPCANVTGAPSNIPVRPFLENPTSCGTPLTANLDIEFYNHAVSHATTPWPGTIGCDQLTFNPSLSATPTTSEGDSPTGVDIDLKVPQNQSPTTPSPSEIRSSRTTLPLGFSLNPGAADGKLSCSALDTAIGTLNGATCPEFSKVGTLSVLSEALPGPIPGAIYLGEPKPGNRFRIILAADGFGTHIKLVGSVQPDPVTGQVVAAFEDLPQAPLTRFNMHFFGSERGLLATPTRCGTYAVKSEFVPWDAALSTQISTSFFTIDSGPNGAPCPNGPRPFSPQLEGGSTNATAGAHAPFGLRITRADGDQNLTSVQVKTPPGFSATLKGVPYCPQSALDQLANPAYSGRIEAEAPACPEASQVGTAVAGAGVGSRPVYVNGRVYLAGPYKGAPISLMVVVPAVSGPYDLGNVGVRVALHIDPSTAQVTANTDPLPQIIEGIPLRVREVLVRLDRAGFALNPTNCDPFAIAAAIGGDEGAIASLSSHFQVSNCADLPFRPKLSLSFSGGLSRLGHPAIHAVLSTRSGDANPRTVSATLPPGELLDNSHIGAVCTRVNFANDSCPAGSRLGRVEVTTPILDQPLTGSVYLRSSSRDLPDLAIDLDGQFQVEAVARIDAVKGRLRASFEAIPDVPLGTVKLDLFGGAKGLIQNSEPVCGRAPRATVDMVGQNGAKLHSKLLLKAKCGSSARHKRHGWGGRSR